MSEWEEPNPCGDCGRDVQPPPQLLKSRPAEWFAVTDEVWRSAGMPSEMVDTPYGPVIHAPGVLCVGCLESRLGRRLTPSDFVDVPVNQVRQWPHQPHTRRLVSRLTGRPEWALFYRRNLPAHPYA